MSTFILHNTLLSKEDADLTSITYNIMPVDSNIYKRLLYNKLHEKLCFQVSVDKIKEEFDILIDDSKDSINISKIINIIPMPELNKNQVEIYLSTFIDEVDNLDAYAEYLAIITYNQVSPYKFHVKKHLEKLLESQSTYWEDDANCMLTINDIFAKLEVEAKAFVDRAECVSKISFIRSFDICYLGQGFAVNVELPSSNLNANKLEIRDYFESVYKSLYGRVYPDMEIELINVRLVAQGEVPVLPKFPLNVTGSLELANKGSRKAYSGIKGKFIEFVIYYRYKLPLGTNFNGPAIIEERESTTIVDTDGHVKVDLNGILVITLSEVKS
jgi:hypothetical protein